MAKTEVLITLEQERNFRRWSKDPVAFCTETVTIESVVTKVNAEGKEIKVPGKQVPFIMRDYQADCVRRFLGTQVCAVLKARQIGLTTTACGLALWLLLFTPNCFILVLSKNDRDAKKFMRRIKLMYERLPLWVKQRAPHLIGKWGVQEAEFVNGSIIFSATSSSDHGRGDTPTHVFLDEVGKMRNQEDSWTALIPATEAGGFLWMFGTANGYRDWFHLKWLEWSADPDVDTIFYGWDVVAGRGHDWAVRMRRKLGEALFKREYPETAEEAFQTSGSNVFSLELLEEIDPWEPRRYRIERQADASLEMVREATDTDEFGLFIYEFPDGESSYLISCDPSEGVVGGDPSVIQVLRWGANTVDQVAVLRGLIDPELFAEYAFHLSLIYKKTTLLVERNNHGGTVLKKLSRLRARNVAHEGGKPGIWTSGASKNTRIIETRQALADERLTLRDEPTITELMGFQEKKTATGAIKYEGAEHDDHVDALCLGVGYAVTYAPFEQPELPVPEDEPPHPFSLDGMMSGMRRRRVRI